MYPHTDEIKLILKDKSDIVQKHGLNYLIPNWETFSECLDSEDLIYEWLNELDRRKIIDEILEVLPEEIRNRILKDLKPIDDEVIAKTFEINECVWGERTEREYNYNRHKHWYYYRMNQLVFESEAGEFTERK
jgi:hypothetical protein